MLSCAPPSGPVTMSTAISGLTAPVLWSPFGPPLGNHIFDTTNWKTPVDIIVQVTSDNDGAYSINLTTNQPATYSPLSINVADSGFRKLNINVTGSTGLLTIKNGADTFQINGSQTYIVNYPVNTAYQFAITSMPAGQICAFKEKQFGTFGTTTMTLNINCVAGQMVGGRYQALPAAPLDYRLYQGKVTSLVSGSITTPNSIIYHGGNLYFGDYGGNRICKHIIGGALDCTFITGLPGVVRGITTDGTNLYFSTINPGNTVYKVSITGGAPSVLATGFSDPFGLATDGTYVFVADKTSSSIKKIEIATGVVNTIAAATTPLGIEIVGNDLYYTSLNSVYRVPKTGTTPTLVYGDGTANGAYQDAVGTSSRFNALHDIVYDGVSNLYVAEYTGSRIRRINLRTGLASTIAGDGTAASAVTGKIGIQAQVGNPVGITTDGKNIYATLHTVSQVIKLTDNGLVGYWPLTGNANDYNSDNPAVAPGNINNGTSTAWPTLTSSSGRFGTDSAYSFDGTTQNITVAQNTAYTAASLTVSAWIKPSSLPAAGGIYSIVDKRANGANPWNGWTLELFNSASGQTIVWNCNNGGGSAQFTVDTTKWTHVAAVQSGTAIKLYANGNLISSANTCFPLVDSGLPLLIGDRSDNHKFTGAIADVRIYARVLGEGEINELAQDAAPALVGNSYNTAATGLLSHYTFDGVAGVPSLTDSGPLGTTLTAVAAPITATIGKDGDANGAYNYNGTTQYLTSPAGADIGLPMGASPRTMCSWVNPAVQPVNTIMTAFRYGTNTPTFNTQLSALVYRELSGVRYVSLTGIQDDAMAAYTLPINTWSHLCATYSGAQTAEFYVNGQKLGTPAWIGSSNTLALNTTSGSLVIGAVNNTNNLFYWNGKIDDVRIYNNALTAAQIRQLATQVPSGLVARYDFNGDANDVSGFGNNVSGGATYNATADRFGAGAYSFDGTSSFSTASAISLPQGNSPRTMCAWYKVSNYSSIYNILHHGGGTAGNGHILTQRITDVASGYWNGDDRAVGNAAYAPGVWQFICGTHDATASNLYINGSLVVSATSSTTLTINSSKLAIGARTDGTGLFIGDIDDVRVYNRALAPNEVQALVQ